MLEVVDQIFNLVLEVVRNELICLIEDEVTTFIQDAWPFLDDVFDSASGADYDVNSVIEHI